MKTTEKHIEEIINHAIDNMSNGYEGTYTCDLHNELFNRDYFIIGNYKAEQFLINGPGIFAAIEEIKEYEQSNFGEVNTDFSSPEKVVNMYVYIQGEEILSNCPTIQSKWDDKLTKADCKKIIKELKAQL